MYSGRTLFLTGSLPGLLQGSELKKYWPAGRPDCLLIPASPTDYVENDKEIVRLRTFLEESCLDHGLVQVWDVRTGAGAGQKLADYRVLILGDGDIWSQNAFFMRIGLRERLKSFRGLVMGVGAGAVNSAETVCSLPLRTGGEADIFPAPFLTGLGLCRTMVLPRYDGAREWDRSPEELAETLLSGPDSRDQVFLLLGRESFLVSAEGLETVYGETWEVKNGIPVRYCGEKETRVWRDRRAAKSSGVQWDVKDRLFSEDRMYRQVERQAVAGGFTLTLKALPMMKQLHEGQYRKGAGGIPYRIHPLMIACHCLALGMKEDELIAAILLHDVMEDCGVTGQELREAGMTEAVIEAVSLVTFEIHPRESRREAKARYYREIEGNRNAMIIKALDRCNNIATMAGGFSVRRMAEYIQETETYIMPLLTRLKMEYPECNTQAFLIKYQMLSILETQKHLLEMLSDPDR